MSLLLHIDTAVESASVCLSDHHTILGLKVNPSQKDSASWVQPAIQELMQEKGLSLKQLEAVSVSAGPGSYTGLRVGMASAKGLCYALHVPLITIPTLKMMSVGTVGEEADLLCPMIDARRMEVFTALYDQTLQEVLPAHNIILEENSFADYLQHKTVCFFGNGAAKFKPLVHSSKARFVTHEAYASNLVPLAVAAFEQKAFADLAYAEPYYGKEFFSTYMKSKS